MAGRAESNALSERSESKGLHCAPYLSLDFPIRRCHRRLTNYFVYILRCANGAFYVGHTDNLELRLSRHNERRGAIFTAGPVMLAFSECYDTRLEAIRRERQLKRWTRAKKEALIAGDLQLLKRL